MDRFAQLLFLPLTYSRVLFIDVKIWKAILLTLRSHTTGEFHGSHARSILPSQLQKQS